MWGSQAGQCTVQSRDRLRKGRAAPPSSAAPGILEIGQCPGSRAVPVPAPGNPRMDLSPATQLCCGPQPAPVTGKPGPGSSSLSVHAPTAGAIPDLCSEPGAGRAAGRERGCPRGWGGRRCPDSLAGLWAQAVKACQAAFRTHAGCRGDRLCPGGGSGWGWRAEGGWVLV